MEIEATRCYTLAVFVSVCQSINYLGHIKHVSSDLFSLFIRDTIVLA
jgi:hypothetical protein